MSDLMTEARRRAALEATGWRFEERAPTRKGEVLGGSTDPHTAARAERDV